MIQRYKFMADNCADPGMVRDVDGEWVRWDDICDLIDGMEGEDIEYAPSLGYVAAKAHAYLGGRSTVFDFDLQSLLDVDTGEVLWVKKYD